jgi:CubicO group peptidase (beta-lactamase class C family)
MPAESSFERVKVAVGEAMERFRVPGVAVGVLQDGQTDAAGFGSTSIENPLAVNVATLFQIGSISKTFTATAVMRLVEAGKLDLEAPLRTYLPELKLASEDTAARITIHHTLTHLSGFPGDFFEDCGPGDDALAKMVARLAELPQLTPLDAVWSYNNAAFCLAGRAIEVVTGLTFERAIQTLLLDPLGMTRTFYWAADAITYRCSVGHVVAGDRLHVSRPWTLPRSTHPFAGVISCVDDLLRWARFHLGDGTAADGTRLLQRETLTRMQTALAPAGSLADEIGITWQIDDYAGTKVVGHNGVWANQMAAFRLVPDRDFAVVVLTNSNEGAQLHGEITARALKEHLDLARSPAFHRDVPEPELRGFTGRYTAILDDVDLTVREGNLVLDVIRRKNLLTQPEAPLPPPVRLAFVGDDRVVALDPPTRGGRGEFVRNPDGSIAWFRWGGRIHRRET